MAARRGSATWCLALALALASVAASAQPVVSQAIAGTTIETAIVLPNITDEFHGVAAEHAYIAAHFPDWHIEYQSLVPLNGRSYDLIGLVKPSGTKTVVYFDITPWFGK